jgi:decaprenyl-phosphate phosphoribosyltransferase
MHHTATVPERLGTLSSLIRLMRPKQWIKNTFVMAPLVFTGEFAHLPSVTAVLFAVFLFCVAASATYIVNDIHDIAADRRHPTKSLSRPLAAGYLSVKAALGLLFVLYGVLIWGAFIAPGPVQVIGAYLLLNYGYTFIFKHEPVVDIFIIALCFVLRVYAGAQALSVPMSGWMFITTMCLALYMAAVKRRQEMNQSGSEGRAVLKKYSVALIDRYAEMSATGALVFYSMFVMSARPDLVITVPVVLFGLFRYWYVVEELKGGESPTDVLMADPQLMFSVIGWVGMCLYTLWPK